MMTARTSILIIALFSLIACKRNTETRIIDKEDNKWSYKGKFEIQLPNGYSFSSSIIMKNDTIKVGEIVLDYELLKTSLTGKEYFEINKEGGRILTEGTGYITGCSECEFIKADSIIINGKNWYYDINKTEFEGNFDWGFWNSFTFANIENNRITIINFNNKDLNDLNIEEYIKILNTIRYK